MEHTTFRKRGPGYKPDVVDDVPDEFEQVNQRLIARGVYDSDFGVWSSEEGKGESLVG
jgi:hypothetical protein